MAETCQSYIVFSESVPLLVMVLFCFASENSRWTSERLCVVLWLQYVGSGVVSELDNPDATRESIANIRQARFITITMIRYDTVD